MPESRPKIAVLTSGGDAPGMNAAIRSVVRSAIAAGSEVVGIERGYEGLLEREFRPLVVKDVGGVLDRGGTFLGTSRSDRFETDEGVLEAADILRAEGVCGLVVIGGDGSYRGAEALCHRSWRGSQRPGPVRPGSLLGGGGRIYREPPEGCV